MAQPRPWSVQVKCRAYAITTLRSHLPCNDGEVDLRTDTVLIYIPMNSKTCWLSRVCGKDKVQKAKCWRIIGLEFIGNVESE